MYTTNKSTLWTTRKTGRDPAERDLKTKRSRTISQILSQCQKFEFPLPPSFQSFKYSDCSGTPPKCVCEVHNSDAACTTPPHQQLGMGCSCNTLDWRRWFRLGWAGMKLVTTPSQTRQQFIWSKRKGSVLLLVCLGSLMSTNWTLDRCGRSLWLSVWDVYLRMEIPFTPLHGL